MNEFNIKYYLEKIKQNNLTIEEKEMLLNLIKKQPELINIHFDELYPFIIKVENERNLKRFHKKEELKKIPQQTMAEYEKLMIKYYEGIIIKEEKKKLNEILKDPIFRKEFKLYGKTYLKPEEKIIFNKKNLLYKTKSKTNTLLYVSLSIAASFIIFVYVLFKYSTNSNNNGEYLQNKKTTDILFSFKKTCRTSNIFTTKNYLMFKSEKKLIREYAKEPESIIIIEETKNTETSIAENKTEQANIMTGDTLLIISEVNTKDNEQNRIEMKNNNLEKQNNLREISLKKLLARSISKFLKNKVNIDVTIVNERNERRSRKGIVINNFEFIASRGI